MATHEKSWQVSKSAVLRPRHLLLGVTAAGPVYKGAASCVVVPVTAVMATLQELGRRILDDTTPVQSSLASRVHGQDAHAAWLSISVQAAGQLQHLSARGRVRFLRIITAYVQSSGRCTGLETLYTSAVNAAWPWLSLDACSHVLELTGSWLRKSEIAKKHQVAVVDVMQRTVRIFHPSELVKLDLAEWRASRALQLIETGHEHADDMLNEMTKSPLEKAIDRFFDTSQGPSADSLLNGNDSSGVPGGLPSLGDLPGHSGTTPGRSQSMEDMASDLWGSSRPTGIPGGLPDASGLPGKQGAAGGSRTDLGQRLLNEAGFGGLSGFLREHGPGGFKTGIFEGATPGGPYAPPGQLPSDGSGGETPTEDIGSAATKIATGAVIVATAAGGPATPIGYVATLVAAGSAGFAIGIAVGIVIFGDPDKPKPPPKDNSHEGDLYPDPIGGGGGNPTQLPVDDGDFHGDPTRLPDSDGHGGGTPNTIFGSTTEGASIWDDNFGHPGPTVRPQAFGVTMAVGPGLMADIVQIGRSTIRY